MNEETSLARLARPPAQPALLLTRPRRLLDLAGLRRGLSRLVSDGTLILSGYLPANKATPNSSFRKSGRLFRR